MLVECGLVRAASGDGREWSFSPSFVRIAELGSPHEIVALYGALHDPAKAVAAAGYILACLCEQEDPTPLVGGVVIDPHDLSAPPVPIVGLMPDDEKVIVAKHLMRHGIAGKARPETAASGKFSDKFEAAEYISAARVHLGLSNADAEALSMTEFQTMMAMKFPDPKNKERDIPTREQYDAAMTRLKERSRV